MLRSLSPPGMLTSSCQPLTPPSSVSHPSPISNSVLLSFFFLFFFHTIASLSLSVSHPSYSPGLSAPLLFDVSLIPPPSFNLGHFPHLSPFPSLAPSLTLLRALLSLRPSFCLSIHAPSTQTSFSRLRSLTSLFRICHLSYFPASSISR